MKAMCENRPRILVASAGITGLTMALALLQHGFERTSKIVRGSSETAKRFHNPALADHDSAVAYVDQEWDLDRARSASHQITAVN